MSLPGVQICVRPARCGRYTFLRGFGGSFTVDVYTLQAGYADALVHASTCPDIAVSTWVRLRWHDGAPLHEPSSRPASEQHPVLSAMGMPTTEAGSALHHTKLIPPKQTYAEWFAEKAGYINLDPRYNHAVRLRLIAMPALHGEFPPPVPTLAEMTPAIRCPCGHTHLPPVDLPAIVVCSGCAMWHRFTAAPADVN